MILALRRTLSWTLAIGGIGFSAGFFGPMIFAPGANQGPLLGILITGPLGLVAGFGVGIWRELGGRTAGPMEVLARLGLLRIPSPLALRFMIGIAGFVAALRAVAGIRGGEGRGAAALLVIAAAALFYGVTGRPPTWFRR